MLLSLSILYLSTYFYPSLDSISHLSLSVSLSHLSTSSQFLSWSNSMCTPGCRGNCGRPRKLVGEQKTQKPSFRRGMENQIYLFFPFFFSFFRKGRRGMDCTQRGENIKRWCREGGGWGDQRMDGWCRWDEFINESEKYREGEVWLREERKQQKVTLNKKENPPPQQCILKWFFTVGFQRIRGDFWVFFKMGLFKVIISMMIIHQRDGSFWVRYDMTEKIADTRDALCFSIGFDVHPADSDTSQTPSVVPVYPPLPFFFLHILVCYH